MIWIFCAIQICATSNSLFWNFNQSLFWAYKIWNWSVCILVKEFKKASINGKQYGFDDGEIDLSWNRFHDGQFKFSDESLINDFKQDNPHVNMFLKILALNHTVMPEYEDVIIDEVVTQKKTSAVSSMKYQARFTKFRHVCSRVHFNLLNVLWPFRG